MDQQLYRKLIARQVPPLMGIPLRLLLIVLSWPYALIIRLRNMLYSHQWLKVHRVAMPVICVGNLTAGGTGKTPLVTWLARWLQAKNQRVAILTRGYKTEKGKLSDEPAELAAACPGVGVVVNPDRVAGANDAIRHHGAQVLVMDDGFQHRRLARDIDIVTIDATAPFGYGHVLPAGLLREPVSGLKRAGAVVLTRTDQVSDEQLRQIEDRIGRINPRLPIIRTVHAPVAARCLDGSETGLDALRGRKVFAFCGLGNPDGFFRTVESCGCLLAGARAFNDHHTYTEACLAEIYEESAAQGVQWVLTTSKDWNKITPLIPSPAPLPTAYLAIELQFTAGVERLTTLIEHAMRGRITRL